MTAREEATFTLLAALLVFCLSRKNIRSAMGSPLRLRSGPKLFIPLVLYVGWLAALTVLVDRFGYWSTDLLAATILWFLFTGFRYFLNLSDIGKKERFFRRSLLELVGGAAFFEFFLNVRTFSLRVELALQVALIFFGLMYVISENNPELKPARNVLGFLLAGLIAWQIAATVANLAEHWSELEPHDLISLFILPLWLTIGTLPVIYLYGLYGGYELLFVRMGFGADSDKASLAARAGVVVELGGRLHRFDVVTRHGAWRAGHDGTFHGARQAVRDAFATEARRRDEELAEARRLIQNAGVQGTDENGRRLDRREFKETCDALRWLATCQMGWYQREEDGGRYRADLLEILDHDFTRHGLPGRHGIAMRVTRDGQAWYAVRQTVTGWVFAIGASEQPPSQWLYDGEKPPNGFPGKDRSWGPSMFETPSTNW